MAVLFVITYGLQSTLVTVLSLLLLLREIRNRTKVNNNILSHGDTSYDGLDRALELAIIYLQQICMYT